MTLTLRVITPDKTVWDDKVEEIILPSTTGQLGILTNHAPLLSALETGVMRMRVAKEWKSIALMGGFAEVENNVVKVLVNSAELGEKINKESARAEYAKAEKNLEEITKTGNRQEIIQATQDFKRARARFQATGGMVSV